MKPVGRTPSALLSLGVVAAILLAAGARTVERVEAKTNDFTLTLSARQPQIKLGHAPTITASLTNHSGTTVTLVPALDGSEMGRYPRVNFVVVPPEDAPAPEELLRCGNTNNIQPRDFVAVGDGESLDPTGEWLRLREHLFTGPGTYRIQLTYDTRETRPESWYGFMGPLKRKSTIDRKLSKVPRMYLESNVLTIEVVGTPVKPIDD